MGVLTVDDRSTIGGYWILRWLRVVKTEKVPRRDLFTFALSKIRTRLHFAQPNYLQKREACLSEEELYCSERLRKVAMEKF
jgi:hypothetical protein